MNRFFSFLITLLSLTWLGMGMGFSRDVPYLSGRVIDEVHILAPDILHQIENHLEILEQKTTAQVVVLILESLEGESVEEYSLKVASTWKLGKVGKDNGILFLVVQQERKMRIEVGYGLEGVIPDALAKRILDQIARPKFRSEKYGEGIEKTVVALSALLQGEEEKSILPENSGTFSHGPSWILFGIFFLLIVGSQSIIALLKPSKLGGWVHGALLTPFWFGFPSLWLGKKTGFVFGSSWLIIFILIRLLTPKKVQEERMKKWITSHSKKRNESWSWGGGGGWFPSGSGSSGGGFSGGGGSFGGGGASSSW